MAPSSSSRRERINALLHQEPYATVFYTIFWTWFLVGVVPIVAAVVLIPLGIYKLIAWHLDWNGAQYFDPKSSRYVDNTSTTELAIVITGCDSGFGKELALVSAQAGYVVFAGCFSKDSFDQFKNTAGTIFPMTMDVTNDGQVKDAANQVSKWLNNNEESSSSAKKNKKQKNKRILHALINNAGISRHGFFDWITVDDYQRVFDVNFFGILRTCKAFLPLLKKQGIEGSHKGGSRILNVTSVAGLLTTGPIGSAYNSSKHASQSFTEALRDELAGFDIQVTSVNPSFHRTEFITSIMDKLTATWNGLSPALMHEYGSDFLTSGIGKTRYAMTDGIAWDLSVVVEEMGKLLQTKDMPAQKLIGIDAQYLFALTRMLPVWWTSIKPPILPGIMKKTKTTS